MANEPKLEGLRRWLNGERKTPSRFSDLWRIVLIEIARRVLSGKDEEGNSISGNLKESYSFDLSLIAEEEGLFLSHTDLQRIASHFQQRKWAVLNRRMPVKLTLTDRGIEEAHRILDDFVPMVIRTTDHLAVKGEDISDVFAPASDRFVRLNDNSSEYKEAIFALEKLIVEIGNSRVNDWEEKEGVFAAARAALEMVRAKYVNKTALLAALSTAVTFIFVKFAEAPLADVATRAWNAVKALF